MKHTPGKWTATTHPRNKVKNGTHKGESCGIEQTTIRTDADTNKNHICNVNGFDHKGSGWTSRKEAIANANLIASAPEMLETLKSIQKIANDTMPSSAYLRHDSGLYNEDKVYLYVLCKTILEKCHNAIAKAGGE